MRILLTSAILFFATISFASTDSNRINNEAEVKLEKFDVQQVMDCTITIKGNFDGVEVELEITVADISWLECASLRTAVKLALK